MRKEMELEGGRDRAFRCRNCLHIAEEGGRGGGTTVPGPYCRNPLGVYSMDDCPVLLGRECMQFVERDGPPAPTTDEELTSAWHELLRDYLRWPYWERVKNLRKKPEDIAKKTVLDVEEKPEREDEEIVYRVPAPVVEGAVAAPKEKPPEERYPGQRRSEDRHRKRALAAAAKAAEAAAAAGLAVPAPAADPVEGAPLAPPPAEAPAGPVVKSIEEVLAETPDARPVHPPSRPRGEGPPRGPGPGPGQGRGEGEGAGEGRGRRRRRRRHGRGGESQGAGRPEGGRTPAVPSPGPSGPPREPAPSQGAGPAAPGVAPAEGSQAGPGGGRHRRRRRRHGPRPGGSGPQGDPPQSPPPAGP